MTTRDVMRALTVLQPAAHLIATGRKRVENRTWLTHFRGPLAIHAGKSRGALEPGDLHRYPGMTFAAVVAVAELVDVLPVDRVVAGDFDQVYPWLRRHAHTHGPWCWVLADVRRLARPLPLHGTLGLFSVPRPVERALLDLSRTRPRRRAAARHAG